MLLLMTNPSKRGRVSLMRNVLVVGSCGGIGSALVRKFLAEGWFVYGIDLRDNGFRDDHYRFTQADVTDETLLESKRAETGIASLDAFIYVAGILRMCSLIEEHVDTTRKVMEVNLFGMMTAVKVFFPAILKGKGRLVLFSSEVGRRSSHPFDGPYSISKHAVEAYADSLRREIQILGIKVVKIECGGVKTPLLSHTMDGFDALVEHTTHYHDNLSALRMFLSQSLLKGCDPDYLAGRVYKATVSRHPKLGYRIRNSFLVKIPDMFGMRAGDWIFALLLRGKRKKR
jgi:NAD(P)-dependent dehydrogenase (short-subunit alcohol dehydrogenase family)